MKDDYDDLEILEIIEIAPEKETNDEKISSLVATYKRLNEKCDLILEKIKQRKQPKSKLS